MESNQAMTATERSPRRRRGNLCACGCGRNTERKSSKFCLGHNKEMYTPERARKISIALKGRERTIEHRQAISKSKKGLKPYISDELREQRREYFLANNPMHNPILKERHRATMDTQEYKDNVVRGLRNHYATPENRKMHGREQTLEKRERNRLAQIERYRKFTADDWARFYATCSKSAKMSWGNGRDKSYLINNIYDNMYTKPNGAESKLWGILESISPGNWYYVGDFSFRIGTKCPDFINFDKNLIIELFGYYWHQGQDPSDRIELFKSYGYKTLIIWDFELSSPESIVERINNWEHRLSTTT